MTENVNDTNTPETVPTLVIELDGERGEFLAIQEINEWVLAEYVEAAKTNNIIEVAPATRALAMEHLQPEEHARFNEFMRNHARRDPDFGEKLIQALFALWNGETQLPKAKPSSDSSTSTGSTDSTLTEPSSDQESGPKKRKKAAGSSTQD